MAGKSGKRPAFVEVRLGCKWPRKSDPYFRPSADAPERWNISIDGPGELRLTCSYPLRDLATKGDLDAFGGCQASYKNANVPDETHLEMTGGEEVVVPGLYVEPD